MSKQKGMLCRPDLAWETEPTGLYFHLSLIGKDNDGKRRVLVESMDSGQAEGIKRAHNEALAALEAWWTRKHQAELSAVRGEIQLIRPPVRPPEKLDG